MRLLMFMYHRVLPNEHPDAVSCELFQRQLDFMQKKFHILSPAEVFEYIRSGTLPAGVKKNCAALSFDDGWTDNLLYADPILKERGLSAMMAVSAGYLYDGEIRDSESTEVLNRTNSEAAAAHKNGDFRSFLNKKELKYLSDSGRWSLEAHGTQHCLGARGKSVLCGPQGESPEAFNAMLREDIMNCRRKLDALTGREGKIFFWPYGHYSTQAAEIVRDCGYDVQFTVKKGACKRNDNRLVLPRIGVSKWKKFRKNSTVFSNPVLSALRSLFSSEQVCFDEFYGENQ